MNLEKDLGRLRSSVPTSLLTAVELGAGLVDGFAFFDSPVGEVVVAFNPEGVSAVDLADNDYELYFRGRFRRRLTRAEPPSGWGRAIEEAIARGNPGKLPIDFRSVTDFQRSVLQTAASIPRGEVRPYSWLAKQVGNPGAVRAVGSTMARNPVPLIIPCHRVVRTDGRIGEYSLGGPEQKWALLTTENADPHRLEVMAARGVRYLASDTTRVFCHPTCRRARGISEGHRIELHNSAAAKALGFRPCLICRPD
jgi:O-6-methylguanine DNA methyltransferase